MNEVNWMQQGWECPKCGAVMAPHVDCCVNCRGNKGGGTATTNPQAIKVDWTGTDPMAKPSATGVEETPGYSWDALSKRFDQVLEGWEKVLKEDELWEDA